MSVKEKHRGLKPLDRTIPHRLDGLAPLFARHGVRLAYLFGSAARHSPDDPAPEDIDLAILAGPTLPFRELYADLSSHLGTDRLDLLDMRHAPISVLFEVVTEGRLLYRAPGSDAEAFETSARSRFRDFVPWFWRSQAVLKEVGVMGLRRESMAQALSELERIAAELDKYRDLSAEDLRRDLSLRWTVERGLLAGLTTIFNVADHVLGARFREHPETYEGLLDALHAHGLISAQLRHGLRGAGGFRNVLVHEYTAIDLEEVVRTCREAPETFRSFAAEILKWLRNLGGEGG